MNNCAIVKQLDRPGDNTYNHQRFPKRLLDPTNSQKYVGERRFAKATVPERDGDTMQQRMLFRPGIVIMLLVLQIIPLLLFPLDVFAPGSQEWWLPALLAIMVLIADADVIARRGATLWPWVLIALTQGINLISRLMLIWPQGSEVVNKTTILDWPYIIATFAAIALSIFVLWYTEKPEVRMALLRKV